MHLNHVALAQNITTCKYHIINSISFFISFSSCILSSLTSKVTDLYVHQKGKRVTDFKYFTRSSLQENNKTLKSSVCEWHMYNSLHMQWSSWSRFFGSKKGPTLSFSFSFWIDIYVLYSRESQIIQSRLKKPNILMTF